MSFSVHSPPAGSPERPTVALSPLRTQSSSPSRCPGQSGRPLSMVSPGPSLGPSPLSSPASRPLLPLSSPLSCLTPPNVSAALLNGESAIPLQPPFPGPSHAPAQGVLASKPEKVRFLMNYYDNLQLCTDNNPVRNPLWRPILSRLNSAELFSRVWLCYKKQEQWRLCL